jgi:uncharacterized protein (DUF58 family)
MSLGRPPKFDFTRRLTAALAYIALAQEAHVSVAAFADGIVSELPAVTGRAAGGQVFEFLSSLESAGPTRLARSAEQLALSKRRRGPVDRKSVV